MKFNQGQNKKTNKQTTTEKILWKIFNLLEKTDDLFYIPVPSLYSRSAGMSIEYLKILRRIGWQKSRRKFTQFIYELKRRGYIKTKLEKDKKAVILTPKGFEKILKINLKQSNKKKRSDGKWQMIIWDIPESYKKTRNRFRTALKLLGFQPLQKSVWICPYNVLKETEKLIKFYQIEFYIKIFLISEIEIEN